MRKIIIVAFCLLCGVVIALAQTEQLKSSCKSLPMKAGEIVYSGNNQFGEPSRSFVITSSRKEVYALTEGTVVFCFKVPQKENQFNPDVLQYMDDNNYLVVVHYSEYTMLQYTMLSGISVKSGDSIKKGDLIGFAESNSQNWKYDSKITVSILCKKEIRDKFDQVAALAFIKKADD